MKTKIDRKTENQGRLIFEPAIAPLLGNIPCAEALTLGTRKNISALITAGCLSKID